MSIATSEIAVTSGHDERKSAQARPRNRALRLVGPADVARAAALSELSAKSELSEAEVAGVDDDFGFDTVPRIDRSRGSARQRACETAPRTIRVDRNAVHARPRAALLEYDSALVSPRSLSERSHAVHPMRRVEQARVGFATLAVTALLTALVVMGMLVVAHVRAGSWGDEWSQSVPSAVDGGAVVSEAGVGAG